MKTPAVIWLLMLVCSAAGLSGCSDGIPRRYPAAGVIRFADGQPVKTGTIEISSGSRWTASAEIGRDGRFVLTTARPADGAVPGEYRAVVRQLILAHVTPVGGHDHGDLVHAKYRDYASTPLTLTIPARRIDDLELIVERAPAHQK